MAIRLSDVLIKVLVPNKREIFCVSMIYEEQSEANVVEKRHSVTNGTTRRRRRRRRRGSNKWKN